jgi:microcystin-dependent protein
MEPFLGQIALFPFNFAPNGWALCAGQILPISQNAALFSLLGTQFGGNGQTNFALPDLQGRAPNSQGQGAGLQPCVMGEKGGQETVALSNSTIPTHNHSFNAHTVPATSGAPAGVLPAQAHGTGRGATFAINTYAESGTATTLAPALVAPAQGGSLPHNNMQPFLVLTWCIALQGIFPSRS